METRKGIDKYRTQSAHYLDNALKAIEAGTLEKASEFLWGSMAQALKAVAASRHMSLRSHKDIQDYALALTRGLEDEGIWHAFDSAQHMHSNFYEPGLTPEYVSRGAQIIKLALAKLFRLIPEPHKN